MRIFKIQFIVCAVSIFLFKSAIAQNFHPFPGTYTAQYTYASGDSIHILKATHQSEENEIVFMPLYVLEVQYDEVLYVQIDSNNIFGQKVVTGLDGWTFYSSEGESWYINPFLPLEEEFTIAPGITGKVISRATEVFLGISDSVITIALNTGKEIKLSENHGFVKAYKFSELAEPEAQPYILSAIPEKDLGAYFFEPFRIFDYEVGDVLGYDVTYQSDVNGSYSESKELKEVVDKEVYTDSIVYTYSCAKRNLTSGSLVEWTEKEVIKADWPADLPLPVIGINVDHSKSSDENSFYILGKIGKSDKGVMTAAIYGDYSYDENTNTFEQIPDASTKMYVAEGLGYVYRLEAGESRDLVCYSTVEEGDCDYIKDVITSVENVKTETIRLAPNPASDKLYIYGDEARLINCTIIDASGRIVAELATRYNAPVDVAHLTDGVYTLKISDQENVNCLRFIKR